MLKNFDKVPKSFGRFVKNNFIIIAIGRREKMKLGEHILKLRKKTGLSQEQLGELVDVTRQTISNWELGATEPNPRQLKLLSKALNVSIDELLDNDIKSVIEEKVSNTEKLAGIIINILKFFAIFIIASLILIIIGACIFSNARTITTTSIENLEISCSLNNKDYLIEVGTDGYYNCSNCDKELQVILKEDYIDFEDLESTEENITSYFDKHNGTCE